MTDSRPHDDLTANLFDSARLWIGRHYPQARFATLVVDVGEDVAPKTTVIIPASDAPSVVVSQPLLTS